MTIWKNKRNENVKIKNENDENIITNDMLDYIKNNDDIVENLLDKNDNVTFKIKRSDRKIKVIKFGTCFICRRKTEEVNIS